MTKNFTGGGKKDQEKKYLCPSSLRKKGNGEKPPFPPFLREPDQEKVRGEEEGGRRLDTSC